MSTICQVCPRHCTLAEGQTGFCQARKNTGGQSVCSNYGSITAMALDPIEKKPLRRFYPGSLILSVGSYGCNMRCPFCQNHELSMHGASHLSHTFLSPNALAAKALSLKDQGNLGLAFTYNEPCIAFEYVKDTARLVHRTGMKNVLVTNGCVDIWVLEELLPWIDAMNIDLKGFTKEYYEKLGGNLNTVKTFIERAVSQCHVELTTLIVPGENDGGELRDLVSWVAELNPDIPLHISRFFPRWKMRDKEATSVETVYAIAEMARESLKYVYTGNC